MEISVVTSAAAAHVVVRGRLDSYWADSLDQELGDVVRAGRHRVELDLSGTTFLSSAGIRVLLRTYKTLEGIGGRLLINHASRAVEKVLELSGLSMLLAKDEPKETVAPAGDGGETVPHPKAKVQAFRDPAATPVVCGLKGDPARLEKGFDASHSVSFPRDTFGLGLGAFGQSFAECRGCFGEFLAVAGAAATLPTRLPQAPDFVLATEALVPEAELCYGLVGRGKLGHRAHFEAASPQDPLPLSDLVRLAFDVARADAVAMAAVVETEHLVGASLKRSPTATDAPESLWEFPGVRKWITFSAEPVYPQSVALVVGVAVRGDGGGMEPMLRPLDNAPGVVGHFHAASFSYKPLPKNPTDLEAHVQTLFSRNPLLGVIHLLGYERQDVFEESAFRRGSFWCGAITEGVK